MKFRTEIEIAPFPSEACIGYNTPLLALGSCFAETISERLRSLRFPCVSNPSGILFNPCSIAAAIRTFANGTPVLREELHQSGQVWCHFGFHGAYSDPNPDVALEKMNDARRAGAEALRMASRVIITFGTAWIYEREGQVVANCHRRPAAEFVRRRLTVAQIVEEHTHLLAGPLAGKQVILSVSPVRHLGDGLAGNALSKATLRLAAEELAESHSNVHYFPAFEILMDDLRDYRFYAGDLAHPTSEATEYVWEKFSETTLTPEARKIAPLAAQIAEAVRHKPLHPESEAFRTFCRMQIARIDALRGPDFSKERAFFEKYI